MSTANPNSAYTFADPNEQNAFNLMSAQLKAWGLDTLLGDLKNLVINGDTAPDTLSLALSQTDAYKTRFAGNATRLANGLSVLSPAEYLATERQYQQIMQSYGLPSGFYDSHADFTDFIGKDISPAELDARAKVAHDQYEAAPEYVKNLWGQYFGGKGDAIAAILDPNTATQVIQDRGAQVAIGGAAAAQGLQVDQVRAQQLQQAGVTAAQADKGYQQIAQAMPGDHAIAQRFGTTFDQKAEENSVLLGQAPDGMKRQTLYDEEQGLFKGKSGANADSIGVSQSH